MTDPQQRANVAVLRRVRWAVRATLTIGVAASVAANVLHARPNLVSQLIAGWPPCALLLAVELVSRVPIHRRALGVGRLGATTVIAAIAGWASYWHMAAVASRYGEVGASAYLLPISVDGLIVVASTSLVELAARIHHHTANPQRGAHSTAAQSAGAQPVTAVVLATPRTPRPGRRNTPMIGELTR